MVKPEAGMKRCDFDLGNFCHNLYHLLALWFLWPNYFANGLLWFQIFSATTRLRNIIFPAAYDQTLNWWLLVTFLNIVVLWWQHLFTVLWAFCFVCAWFVSLLNLISSIGDIGQAGLFTANIYVSQIVSEWKLRTCKERLAWCENRTVQCRTALCSRANKVNHWNKYWSVGCGSKIVWWNFFLSYHFFVLIAADGQSLIIFVLVKWEIAMRFLERFILVLNLMCLVSNQWGLLFFTEDVAVKGLTKEKVSAFGLDKDNQQKKVFLFGLVCNFINLLWACV